MSKRIWVGSLFLLVGVGILFHQIGVWDFGYIFKMWWPLLLVGIGVFQLFNRGSSSPVVSLMIILIGTLFLLNNWLDINLVAFIWPLILIFIGLTIMFSRRKHRKVLNSHDSVEAFSIFAGTNIHSQSDDFRGGNVETIFGGVEIDIRDVIISEDGATIDLTAIFGGIDITVPSNVRVEVSGLPIFGGWEDKTRRSANDQDAPVIKINCLAIFGGVEIKD